MSVEVAGDTSPDVLRCTVCLEDYRPYGPLKPRILPVCLHTFCEGCLEKLGVDNAYSISCPICRVFNDVFGKDGIQALPINTRVPYYETMEEETTEESDLMDFIDPSVPSCPVCGSITLFAPFGLEADITQCHTCQWVSAEVMEVEKAALLAPSAMEVHIDKTATRAKTKQSARQKSGPQPRKRKTLGGRLMSYLRKRFSSR